MAKQKLVRCNGLSATNDSSAEEADDERVQQAIAKLKSDLQRVTAENKKLRNEMKTRATEVSTQLSELRVLSDQLGAALKTETQLRKEAEAKLRALQSESSVCL